MRIDVLTLFPEMVNPFITNSIIKRAIENKKVEINVINIRDFSKNKHKQVDDTPYGGGPGMVLMCEPIFDAVESVKKEDSIVIMTSPKGKKYNQKFALDLSKEKHLIILCGHYEGFDERIKSIVDIEISIGNYILTGGEIPACAIIDSTVRLLDGVINKESLVSETFTGDLVDYPVYTKPRVFRGMEVPEVLLSGDHKKIEEYRNKMREENSK